MTTEKIHEEINKYRFAAEVINISEPDAKQCLLDIGLQIGLLQAKLAQTTPEPNPDAKCFNPENEDLVNELQQAIEFVKVDEKLIPYCLILFTNGLREHLGGIENHGQAHRMIGALHCAIYGISQQLNHRSILDGLVNIFKAGG